MKWAFIIFAVVIIGGIIMLGYTHEKVHQLIFSSYGIDSKINLISDFPDMTTTPINQTLASKNCNETCWLQHNMNEAISYPLLPIIVMISMGLFFIIVLLAERNEIEIFRIQSELNSTGGLK